MVISAPSIPCGARPAGWYARCAARQEEPYGVTGYDATGWDATVWVVHAMYETDEIPSDITHDEAWRIERAAGAS